MNIKPLYLLIATALVSCQSVVKPVQPEPVVLKTAQVTTDTLARRHTFIGTITANYVAIIQPRVNGYLSAKIYSNGMPVKKGQVIFRIDDRSQRANILSAQASLDSAIARLTEAENNYSRAIPLAAIDAISKLQFDQYTAQYKAATSAVNSAQQTLANARLELEYTTIKATIDGIISTSEAYVGDYVGPGTKFSTLTRIENIDTVCVDIAIPVRQYLEWSGRREFTFNNDSLLSDIDLYLTDGSLYPYKGSYSFTRTSVADNEGTIVIVVNFPNPDYSLKTGQFARVKCNIGADREVLTLPYSAINQVQGINSVWMIDADSCAHYREVGLGERIDQRVVVTSGLQRGQMVAADGYSRLTNGQKVKLYE